MFVFIFFLVCLSVQSLEPWLVSEVRMSGDLNLISVLASGLPTSEDLDHIIDLEALKSVPLLPEKRLELFIGVFSTANNFKRRMAVRRTWMQYAAVRSGAVAVRFFVGLVSFTCELLSRFLLQNCHVVSILVMISNFCGVHHKNSLTMEFIIAIGCLIFQTLAYIRTLSHTQTISLERFMAKLQSPKLSAQIRQHPFVSPRTPPSPLSLSLVHTDNVIRNSYAKVT